MFADSCQSQIHLSVSVELPSLGYFWTYMYDVFNTITDPDCVVSEFGKIIPYINDIKSALIR